MAVSIPTAEQVFRRVPCFCAVLTIAARSVSRLYNDELRLVGLEVTQHALLAVLRQLGRVTVGELGERLAVDKTTISRNVKVLERNGWVSVERGKDGRERVTMLTDSGAKKLNSAKPAWDRAQHRMQEAMSSKSFETIRRQMPDVALAAITA